MIRLLIVIYDIGADEDVTSVLDAPPVEGWTKLFHAFGAGDYRTRTEATILQRHAAEIVALLPGEVTLVELGSGSSAKTRLLIEV